MERVLCSWYLPYSCLISNNISISATWYSYSFYNNYPILVHTNATQLQRSLFEVKD